jgi:hypothetical protein
MVEYWSSGEASFWTSGKVKRWWIFESKFFLAFLIILCFWKNLNACGSVHLLSSLE